MSEETVTESIGDAVVDNPNHIKTVATEMDFLVAQAALFIMALVPIYLGTIASVKNKRKKQESRDKGEEVQDDDIETLSSKDAMKFPLTASCALFGLYVIVKNVDPKYLNYLLSSYFMIIGLFAMTSMLINIPALVNIFPAIFKSSNFHLKFLQNKESVVDIEFTYVEIVFAAISLSIGGWYIVTKHWIANNLLAVAFSMNAVQLLYLGTFKTGAILLSGLFFYDIFWVFGTEVMVSVAKTINAPIKIIFPTDFLTNGVFGTRHSMLGLGDIVIPGIMVALLARFDFSLKRNSNTYFYAGLFSYVLGLGVTMMIMNIFKHAQPALLYLVPSNILTPLVVAWFKGDIQLLFSYEDEEKPKDEAEKPVEEKKDE